MADVEMKPADSDDKKEEKKIEEEKKEITPVADIKTNILLIERAVSNIEPRFTNRVLRTLSSLRKKTDDNVLKQAIEEVYLKDSPVKTSLLSWIPNASYASSDEQEMDVDSKSSSPEQPVPEVDIYFRLLIIHYLLNNPSTYRNAIDLSHETVNKMQALNRRSMDPIAAKVWFAVERAHELGGELADARSLFLAAQRTASLRHDDQTQASLINCLLRSYLNYSLFSQADKLISKTTFPTSAPNTQFARYHYYIARIRAVQLNYSDAHVNIQQAIRRAPPAETAPGFWQAIHKLSVVVELLMGDIPDRGIFRHKVLQKDLVGYLEIVRTVRAGSLSQFQSTLSTYTSKFQADNTFTLIARLRQNVIKTGIRRLSLSYSRISLRDICVKLHLDSEEDAEYIVGKAIRDGVIDAKINHEKGWMECGLLKGGYGPEVAEVFQRRIGYCLELHNESVKAMRYPLNAHRKELAAAEGAREREKELAKEIQEGELDDDDMGGEF